ncbi:hypothetical protein A0H81_02838 [Grifola frondosa]|uniref:Uncharacterized protein n=1 Tax=Grifola frondosa TaxID=5627 RepID=A0A1C7MLY7_GRIFR|nr:hypothetical protein A0H81_02838 [Grifola frondosa]
MLRTDEPRGWWNDEAYRLVPIEGAEAGQVVMENNAAPAEPSSPIPMTTKEVADATEMPSSVKVAAPAEGPLAKKDPDQWPTVQM